MTERQAIPRFRAWHKKWEEMGNVKRIRFDDDGNISTVLFKGKLFGVNAKIDEVILMQSTGIKDKNGKEIFEGDLITRIGVFNSVVKYGKWQYEEDFGVKSKSIGFYIDNSYEDGSWYEPFRYTDVNSNYEVVGNIYENGDKVGYGDE